MSEIVLYHGSDKVIERPQFGRGGTYNDFGKGFYCTDDFELAKEWACALGKNGVVNEYNLEIDGLETLDLTSESFNVLNWIGLILKNRTFDFNSSLAFQGKDALINAFAPRTEGSDMIYGYRSDNSYFTFVEDFVNGIVSLRELETLLKFDELSKQYAIVSPTAYEKLVFKKHYIVDTEKNKKNMIERDIQLLNFRDEMSFEKVSMMDEIYILDILRS